MTDSTPNIVRNTSTSSSNEEEWRNAQTNTFLSETPPQYEYGEPQVQVIDNKIVIKQITFPQRVSITFQILLNISFSLIHKS